MLMIVFAYKLFIPHTHSFTLRFELFEDAVYSSHFTFFVLNNIRNQNLLVQFLQIEKIF